MKSITTDSLQELVESGRDINLIDVREAEEVAYGMIPGAVHIPLGQLPEQFDELDKSKEYHVICKAGGRSAMACDYLANNGIQTVNIEGGMMDWDGEVIA
ncbi:rhodanese-like domain-containing protein [Planococcus sp. N028]|uniref:Rhodanese-like domain-containing protein n=1 Tax=Planococcus shixiaomingii TaxID=3058393 RepID=A0ABT8N0J7_9BACL|nr:MULTISPECIES: rhodanese-like domain-containing protein [unclassified Planococcus (in: firmicutes)]MDN7241207.1 rhodanese-like domain-containing protein [Planococcus sp. N028]WKA53468.1 rhodanese-like domain-containing protein [Planococcus sp. N022]